MYIYLNGAAHILFMGTNWYGLLYSLLSLVCYLLYKRNTTLYHASNVVVVVVLFGLRILSEKKDLVYDMFVWMSFAMSKSLYRIVSPVFDLIHMLGSCWHLFSIKWLSASLSVHASLLGKQRFLSCNTCEFTSCSPASRPALTGDKLALLSLQAEGKATTPRPSHPDLFSIR